MRLSLVMLAAAFVGVSAFGTVCKMGKMERKIEVATTNADKKVPCEVKYTRDGEEKTLYNAQVDATYCDTKAEELIAKLTNQGWQCDPTTTPPVSDPAATPPAASEEKKAEEQKKADQPAPDKKK